MALPANQYRTMRDLFRIMLSVQGIGPQDSDVLSFFKQLLADAAGATPLSSARNFLCGEVARAILSGNASNPSDADIATFWTQLAADASGAIAMGATPAYFVLRSALRAALSCDALSPTDTDVLGYFAAYSFSGDYGALFAGAGLTVKAYRIGNLGLGGSVGTGLGSWANQRGDALALVPNAGGTNGIGSAGTLNGKQVLVLDGSTQNGLETFTSSAVPGTTPRHRYTVQLLAGAGTGYVFGSVNGCLIQKTGATADQQIYNGSAGAVTVGEATGQWHRMRASWIGGLDIIRVGSHEPAPVNVANTAPGNTWGFGCTVAGLSPVAMSIALEVDCEGPLANFLATAATADALLASTWPGATSIEI